MTAEPGHDVDDGDWWEDEFDPDTSPDYEEQARLAGLSPEEQDEQMARPWTADGEAWAAGFVHRLPGRRGLGFAAGGVLDQLPPGQVLAGFAAEAQADLLEQLEDSELVGLLCAWRRLASWAAAGEVAAVITLARHRAAQAREKKNPHLMEHVGDELAAALTLTGRASDRLLSLSAGLARLGATLAALTEGLIDWPRAMVFVDELAALADGDALAAEAMVLPGAEGMTTGQLRAALRRAVMVIDPEAAGRRRRAGRQEACVEFWNEPSGNAGLAGRELPPAEVIAADQRITALARWLKARGAAGTMDQLRAAVFTALLGGMPVESLLPQAPDPASDPASDPEHAIGGEPADDPDTPDGPDIANGPDTPAASSAQPVADPGANPVANPNAAAEATAAGASPAARVTGSVNLTMPLAAWLEMSQAPGEVPGYGSVDAWACRDLAARLAGSRGARWCVTLTDPDGRAVGHACARHGPGPPGSSPVRWLSRLRPCIFESGTCTHQRESPGYRPPPSLRHLLAIRQRTCAFPGCRRPAIRCDDDHTVPYDQGGRTCECNMSPLCRRHHEAKQAPGWQLDQAEPGVLTWTLPHGRSYTTRPDPYPA
jgi:hypothetical protein